MVGAGITGLYQLYRAREEGFSVQLLEAGDGVGAPGTGIATQGPGSTRRATPTATCSRRSSSRIGSGESTSPNNPRSSVTSITWWTGSTCVATSGSAPRSRPPSTTSRSGTWHIAADDGTTLRARFLIAATGVLSVPYYPEVPGREDFSGESYHTGLWPDSPVDFAGKRVAVIGTGSSGVQVIPTIADEVASLTVYQRTANWCTPLNNAPITPDEQARLRAGFESMREVLNTSPSGFLHLPHDRATFDDSKEERWAFFEQMWSSPGFSKLTSNYSDLLMDEAANAEWCKFVSEKIRDIVEDPETAEKLIPTDHRFGEKRPPFVTSYFEAYNNPHVELVDLKQTPILRMTESGIETSDGVREFDIVVWATGFDFGTGALARMGVRGRDGVTLEDHWADGPRTFLGVQTTGFPNFFFPGGPHAAAGNNPRYNGDQVDFITETLVYLRSHGFDTIEVDAAAEETWTAMIDRWATRAPHSERAATTSAATSPVSLASIC